MPEERRKEEAQQREPLRSAPEDTSIFRKGDEMLAQQQASRFKAFKLGLLLMNLGMAFWALFLGLNQMTLAFGASAIAAVGANILMLAVLGDLRHD